MSSHCYVSASQRRPIKATSLGMARGILTRILARVGQIMLLKEWVMTLSQALRNLLPHIARILLQPIRILCMCPRFWLSYQQKSIQMKAAGNTYPMFAANRTEISGHHVRHKVRAVSCIFLRCFPTYVHTKVSRTDYRVCQQP